MRKMLRYLFPALVGILLLSLPSIAATIVEAQQGQPGNKGPWPVIVGGAPAAVPVPVSPYGQTYSPQVPTIIAYAAATSANAVGLVAGSCMRLACSTDVFYRTAGGAPVAVVTDSPLSAKTVERFCLLNAETAIAVISASAGSCAVSRVNTAP